MWSNGKSCANPENKGDKPSFIEERKSSKGFSKPRVNWRKLGVRSVVAFHWLSGRG